ncbi:unnamed protein product [Colias eurytheme]|nr:unnamed protein product [Colias eurytheme]
MKSNMLKTRKIVEQRCLSLYFYHAAHNLTTSRDNWQNCVNMHVAQTGNVAYPLDTLRANWQRRALL